MIFKCTKHKSHLQLLAFVAAMTAALFCNQTLHADDICKDGKFDIALRWGHGASQVFLAGEKIGNWDVKSGSVELLDRDGRFFKDNQHSGKAVDLSGWFPGSISQDLATESGKKYKVSFSYSGNWWDNYFGKKIQVTVAGVTKEFTFERPANWSVSSMQWQTGEIEFVAQADKSTIEFKAVQQWWHHNGMVIADVQVEEVVQSPSIGPAPLNTVKVPLPSNLDEFVKNREKAILLGKAFFWDMQSSSDGRVACATCHHAAGVDHRVQNTIAPGAPGSAFGSLFSLQEELGSQAVANFGGANRKLSASDFPFHRRQNPIGDSDNNPTTYDSMEVVGSQGVVKKDFVGVVEGSAEEDGQLVFDPIFNIHGANARQVTGRNTPTTLNAIFYDRVNWDGRANHFFNGVNSFGDMDPNARVLKNNKRTVTETKWQLKWFSWWGTGWWIWGPVTTVTEIDSVEPVHVLLNNAAVASQAVGPPLSNVETSWNNRPFVELGRKMLSLRPLASQFVHPDDSVLGPYSNRNGNGLNGVDYASLIRDAFHDSWWSSKQATDEGYTQMESNFTLFWGVSILMYQSTLVTDQTPYDRFAAGDEHAIGEAAKRGLTTFVNEGRCIICHGGPEFTTATVGAMRGGPSPLLVFNLPKTQGTAFVDAGFANIGVRPTAEDLGLGAWHPTFGAISYAQRAKDGVSIGQTITIGPNERLANAGSFKIPTLRNIELTGPYFHNGGARTLREAVEFYVRGADFKRENVDDVSTITLGIPELQNDSEGVDDMVEFLKTLTDDRVRYQKAPFDHPELNIPNGHSGSDSGVATDEFIHLPAVGRSGGDRIQAFEEIVN